MFSLFKKPAMPRPGEALPGRADPIPTAETHFVNGRPLKGPYPEGLDAAMAAYGAQLTAAGYGKITTEVLPAPEFYFAEDYHQQYLAKNPGGYCGVGGAGVSRPVGLPAA